MNSIDTSYLKRCIEALDIACSKLQKYNCEAIEFEVYRSAVVKELEIILEQSGKLLKKLRPFFHTNKAVDQLYFKDLFRHAALHDLLPTDEVERWLEYRDNRNSTRRRLGQYDIKVDSSVFNGCTKACRGD